MAPTSPARFISLIVGGTLSVASVVAQTTPTPEVTPPGQNDGKPPAPSLDTRRRFDGMKVVRVRIRSIRDQRVAEALGLEPFNCRAPSEGPTDYLADAKAAQALADAGLETEVIIDDVQTLIDAEFARIQASQQQRGLNWFAEYKDYAQIRAYTESLAAARPDLASNIVAGRSLQGRDQFGLRITSTVGTDKPAIVIHGLQHAREWITGMSTTYVADRLVRTYDTDPAIHTLLDTYEFYIIPVMNPDGYVYTWTNNRLWRKNRRPNPDGTFGIDLNRNWGYQWGALPQGGSSGSPNNDTYRGPAPFSEPETTAMSQFVIDHPNVLMYVDVHSYSQLVLSAWGYTDEPPPDASLFDVLNAGIVSAIHDVHGMTYVGGPTYTTIYPANGTSTDWVYGERNVLGWGPELRDTGENGFLLPADQIVPNAQEFWAGFEWAALWLKDNSLFFGFPAGQPTTAAPDTATPVVIEVGRALQLPESGSVRVFARVGSNGPFTESTPGALSGNLFQASLPAAACGESIQFYLQATAESGMVVTHPPAGPTAPLTVAVAPTVTLLADDAEANLGWTLGVPADDAASGRWVRGDPMGTSVSGVAVQPENDHTPGAGANCFFTGQGTAGGGAGQADVDGGVTTLLSPRLDLSTGSNQHRLLAVVFQRPRGRSQRRHVPRGRLGRRRRDLDERRNGRPRRSGSRRRMDPPRVRRGGLHHPRLHGPSSVRRRGRGRGLADRGGGGRLRGDDRRRVRPRLPRRLERDERGGQPGLLRLHRRVLRGGRGLQ